MDIQPFLDMRLSCVTQWKEFEDKLNVAAMRSDTLPHEDVATSSFANPIDLLFNKSMQPTFNLESRLRDMIKKEIEIDPFKDLPTENDFESFKFGNPIVEAATVKIPGVLDAVCVDLLEDEDVTVITPLTTVYQTRRRLIDTETANYNKALDQSIRLLRRMKRTFDEGNSQLLSKINKNISKFELEVTAVPLHFEDYYTAIGYNNKRINDKEMRLRGEGDDRLVDLLKTSNTTANHLALDPFLQGRRLSHSVRTLLRTSESLHSAVQDGLKESHTLRRWVFQSYHKIVSTIINNHKEFTEYLASIESTFIELMSESKDNHTPLIASKDCFELVERPGYERSGAETEITVTVAELDELIIRIYSKYQSCASLQLLANLAVPMDCHGLGNVVVLNGDTSTNLKDLQGKVIPTSTPLILNITWDRALHLFRSHDDAESICSVHSFDIRPELYNEDLMVIRDDSYFGLFGSVISPKMSFRFTNPGDLTVWKTLLRHSCTATDDVFLSFAKSNLSSCYLPNEHLFSDELRTRIDSYKLTDLGRHPVFPSRNTPIPPPPATPPPALATNDDEHHEDGKQVVDPVTHSPSSIQHQYSETIYAQNSMLPVSQSLSMNMEDEGEHFKRVDTPNFVPGFGSTNFQSTETGKSSVPDDNSPPDSKSRNNRRNRNRKRKAAARQACQVDG